MKRRTMATSGSNGEFARDDITHGELESLCRLVGHLERLESLEVHATSDDRYAVGVLPRKLVSSIREVPDTGLRETELRQRQPRAGTSRRGWLRVAAAIVFALIVWAIYPDDTRTPTPPAPDVVSKERNSDIAIEHIPGAATDTNRVDLFKLACNSRRAFMVFVRGWDPTCSCVEWHNLIDEDVVARGELQPNEPVYVEVDVSDHPPVEQYFIVLSAPSPDELPWGPSDRDALISCLTSNENCDERALEGRLDETLSCLSPGVSVCGQSFVVH